jgi:hypothetical protein
MLVLGAAEHGAEHLGEHDERRQAAMRVESRDVARNEDSDSSGDRRVTCAVNALLTICTYAELTHDLQPFDNAGEVFLHRLLRPFAQPDEQRASLFVVDGEQCLQTGDGLFGYPLDKIFVRPLASKSTARQRHSLQSEKGRKQDASLAQMFDHRGNDRVATIRTGRLLDRDMRHSAIVVPLERSEAEICLEFAETIPAFTRSRRCRARTRRRPPTSRRTPARWAS